MNNLQNLLLLYLLLKCLKCEYEFKWSFQMTLWYTASQIFPTHTVYKIFDPNSKSCFDTLKIKLLALIYEKADACTTLKRRGTSHKSPTFYPLGSKHFNFKDTDLWFFDFTWTYKILFKHYIIVVIYIKMRADKSCSRDFVSSDVEHSRFIQIGAGWNTEGNGADLKRPTSSNGKY